MAGGKPCSVHHHHCQWHEQRRELPGHGQRSGVHQHRLHGHSYYTAVLTGYINLPAGVANFSTKSDDGSVLFIDGNNTPVVNNNAYQGETAKSGSTGTLSAGLHAIEIAYYQGTGNAGLTAYSDLTETNLLANSQLFCYPAATAYANAVNVTNNSTLDLSVVGAGQAVSFGGLTLGSSNGYGALKITGGSNNAVTFTGSNVVTAREFFNFSWFGHADADPGWVPD